MAIRKIIKRSTDSLFVNTEFDGTEAIKPPVGTTGERANAAAGDIRFNTTTALMEYYDGAQWKGIDGPPNIQSISPTNIADTDTSEAIVITGTNFSTSPVVKAIGQNSSEITPSSVVRNSASQLTATFNGTQFSDAQEDYGISVTNTSGLAFTLADALAVNASPAWTVASGSLGTIYDAARSGVSITTGASDDEGASLTYSVSTGSLPSGLSIASNTGTITGTAAAVGSDTTTNFTLSVTDGTNAVTRAYSIITKAPVITSYTSTGSGTFSVPSGVSAVNALVVAGGGGGGFNNSGGGGAGGLIYRPAFPVTPGGSVSYTVGGGGDGVASVNQGATVAQNAPFAKGSNSVFGTLTAIGGGVGASSDTPDSNNGGPGGSGGGGAGEGDNDGPGGTGVQPSQPGDSGTYGFGNPGGNGSNTSSNAGGAGGGAGGTGGNAQTAILGGLGGAGRNYDISGSTIGYSGGGGGGNENSGAPQTGGVATQGGGNGGGTTGGQYARAGTANRGGGGGGAGSPQTAPSPYSYPGQTTPSEANGGPGGSGIVIVSY